MNRPDPFNPQDGCGRGQVQVHPDGIVDKIYDLWNRNPVTVTREFMTSFGKSGAAPRANRVGY
jgi:hypothetical protein